MLLFLMSLRISGQTLAWSFLYSQISFLSMLTTLACLVTSLQQPVRSVMLTRVKIAEMTIAVFLILDSPEKKLLENIINHSFFVVSEIKFTSKALC